MKRKVRRRNWEPFSQGRMVNKSTPCLSPYAFHISVQPVLVCWEDHTSRIAPGGSGGEESVCDQEDPLEQGMATHSSILVWTEEPGGLQPTGSQKSQTGLKRLSTQARSLRNKCTACLAPLSLLGWGLWLSVPPAAGQGLPPDPTAFGAQPSPMPAWKSCCPTLTLAGSSWRQNPTRMESALCLRTACSEDRVCPRPRPCMLPVCPLTALRLPSTGLWWSWHGFWEFVTFSFHPIICKRNSFVYICWNKILFVLTGE